jgi:hypothetical protein
MSMSEQELDEFIAEQCPTVAVALDQMYPEAPTSIRISKRRDALKEIRSLIIGHCAGVMAICEIERDNPKAAEAINRTMILMLQKYAVDKG